LITIDDSAKERIKTAMLDMAQKHNCRVILTNGSKEIFAVDSNTFFEVGVQSVRAVNSTGCGDAFTAGLAAFLDEGATLNEAIAKASRCGAMNAALIRPGVIR